MHLSVIFQRIVFFTWTRLKITEFFSYILLNQLIAFRIYMTIWSKNRLITFCMDENEKLNWFFRFLSCSIAGLMYRQKEDKNVCPFSVNENFQVLVINHTLPYYQIESMKKLCTYLRFSLFQFSQFLTHWIDVSKIDMAKCV